MLSFSLAEVKEGLGLDQGPEQPGARELLFFLRLEENHVICICDGGNSQSAIRLLMQLLEFVFGKS